MQQQTFDLEGAAAFLKVSVSIMQSLADSGEVPGAKIARSWVFTNEDLNDYLVAQVREQTAARRDRRSDASIKVPTAFGQTRRGRGKQRAALPTLEAASVDA